MKAMRLEEISPNISDEPVSAIYCECTRDEELRSHLELILERNHRSRFSFNGLLPYIVVCEPTMHSQLNMHLYPTCFLFNDVEDINDLWG